jgi:hypothetical protein
MYKRRLHCCTVSQTGTSQFVHKWARAWHELELSVTMIAVENAPLPKPLKTVTVPAVADATTTSAIKSRS